MRRYLIPALIALVVSVATVWAAAPGVINSYVGVCDPNFPARCAAPNSSGQLPITGTITTTATNFTPTGAATLSVSNSSSNVALPTTDTTLVIQNVGQQVLFFALGVGNTTTATTSSNSLPPGGMISVVVGSNTYFAAITSSGTTTANLMQGTGVPTLAGGPVVPSGAAGTANANVVSVQGIASMTKLLVTPDSVALPANQSVNVNQFGGNAVVTGTGAGGNGIPRVTISNDSSLAANQSTNLAQVAGATTATGHGTASGALRVELPTDGTGIVGLAAGSNTIGALTANQSVNVAQISGTTTATGNGTSGAGNIRVNVASDNTAFPVNAQPTPVTSGGLSWYFVQPSASDNHAVIKNGAGQVYHIAVTNNQATINYLRLYNAGTGFNGCNSATNLVGQWAIPGNANAAGFVEDISTGVAFGTGISICVTSGYATTDTTNATASAMSVNIGYK